MNDEKVGYKLLVPAQASRPVGSSSCSHRLSQRTAKQVSLKRNTEILEEKLAIVRKPYFRTSAMVLKIRRNRVISLWI